MKSMEETIGPVLLRLDPSLAVRRSSEMHLMNTAVKEERKQHMLLTLQAVVGEATSDADQVELTFSSVSGYNCIYHMLLVLPFKQ